MIVDRYALLDAVGVMKVLQLALSPIVGCPTGQMKLERPSN